MISTLYLENIVLCYTFSLGAIFTLNAFLNNFLVSLRLECSVYMFFILHVMAVLFLNLLISYKQQEFGKDNK